MQGEILASPTRTKEMILIKQPIGVVALITPVSILFGFWIMFCTVTTCYFMALVGHTELYPASSCFVLYLSVEDCWYNAFAKIMTTVHVYGALIIHLLHFWFAHSPMELIKFQCMHPFYALCAEEWLGIFWSRILVEKVMVTVQDWVSISGHFLWDLWSTEWHWDRFVLPRVHSFCCHNSADVPYSFIYHSCCIILAKMLHKTALSLSLSISSQLVNKFHEFYGAWRSISLFTATHDCPVSFTILTLRLLMSYIYGAPILGVSRSHTTMHHSR